MAHYSFNDNGIEYAHYIVHCISSINIVLS